MAYLKSYKNKKGKFWKYEIDVGIDPATGKRKKKSESGFLTKSEAREAAKKMQEEFMQDKNMIEFKKDILLKDYLEKWINEYKTDVKEGSMIIYRYNIKHYIIPCIGYIKLSDFNFQMNADFINKLYDERNLSTSTIRLINGTLHNAMKKAIRLGLIKENPCDHAEFRKAVKKEKNKLQYFSFEESRKFLEQAKEEREYIFYYFFLAALETGMRKSELMALEWKNVDIENKLINVEAARLYRSEKKGEIVIGMPKTSAGERLVIMSDELQKALIELKSIQKDFKSSYWFNRKYLEYDFVFCYRDFRPLASRSLHGAFERITKKAGLPRITIHDLRHTHAVRLREAGVSLEDIQSILGHANLDSTLIYAHVTTLVKNNAIAKYNAFKNSQ